MSDDREYELLGLTQQQLAEVLMALDEPRFRSRQLFHILYRQRLPRLEMATTLPRRLLERLAQRGYRVGLPSIVERYASADGTVRYLLGFADGRTAETVWMPDGDGSEEDDEVAPNAAASSRRATICLSSQCGCAVNCAFCLTARLGFERQLSAGEIVGQVLALLNDHRVEIGRDRVNLVFMGQGEPFLNYDNFMQAVRLLVDGVGLAAARMTVSTSGILPQIERFGHEPVRPHLAISLNAPTDELRRRLMPITAKYPLDELMDAARRFPLRSRENLTFEYVLLAGVNDQPTQACQLVKLLHGLRAKVNLIALNPGSEIPFASPSDEAVAEFRRLLSDGGLANYLRRPRGRDIHAACGQLKRSHEDTPLG